MIMTPSVAASLRHLRRLVTAAQLVAAFGLALPASLAAQVPVPAPDTAAVMADSTTPPIRTRPESLTVNRVVAVVGSTPILLSEVEREIASRIARRMMEAPPDAAARAAAIRSVTNELVEAQILVQKAVQMEITVSDEELNRNVEQHVAQVTQQFPSPEGLREALAAEGLGTVEEFRTQIREDFRRQALPERVIARAREDGLLAPSGVTEAEVEAALREYRDRLPQKPPAASFRQIVIKPAPTSAAREAARAKAESLLVELRGGADFEIVARRESMDPGSGQLGGDLGWNRRGKMVPAFDYWMFELPPGRLSPVIETEFGYHIMRVDRIQPTERKARHILISAVTDSADVERARTESQSVLERWRAGASFDSLVALHHDTPEEKLINDIRIDQLPPAYSTALGTEPAGTIVGPFTIENPRGPEKFVVLEVIDREFGGQMTETEARSLVREQLAQERTIRRYLDRLRNEFHVAVMLDDIATAGPPRR